MKKSFTFSLKLLSVILGFCICLSLLVWKQKAPVTLHLGVFAGSGWNVPSPDSYQIIDAAIAKFESENPGVSVEYVSGIQTDDYSEWLADQAVSGNLPDVFMILPEDFDTYRSIGALEPLQVWMYSDHVEDSAFYESALCASKFEDIQYALPFESNVELLFVNTTLLENEGIELPETLSLEDFYSICSQVTKDTNADGWLDQFGISDYTWKQAADAFGVELFNANGTKVDLTSSKFAEAFSFASSLTELNQKMDISSDPFSEGKAAFAVLTFADYRTYKPYPWKIKRLSSFQWTVMPLPGNEDSISEVETIQMAVSACSKNKEESWKLLKTLCLDPQIQELHYEYSQGISALRGLDKPASEDSEVDYSILDQVMNQPVRKAHFSGYSQALEMVDQEISQILDAQSNQEILLMQTEDRINRYLNQ